MAAAAAVLGAESEAFSLEAAAKAAGVIRRTVYNQFGSRRALLEAVFDDRATRAGMSRLAEAIGDSDPLAGLQRVIAIFCDFWDFDREVMKRLYAECARDPEFAEAVRERNERRRRLLTVLVDRITKTSDALRDVTGELVDVLFALTSFAFFVELTTAGRPAGEACAIIQTMASNALARANGGSKIF